MTDQVAVALNPVPGFCVKSRATNDPAITASDIRVEKGTKIFVNIAWDSNIPPPPPATDDAIHRAMLGLDADQANPNAWFVPIVLSDPRKDTDKAGQPAIVFDCVLNPSIKSRCLRDPNFKDFIIELALQRIETNTTLVLSRQVSIPNIASKGKLLFRQALVSVSLYPPGHPNHGPRPTLVQEITNHGPDKTQQEIMKLRATPEPRIPAWSCTQRDSHIRIVFDVPGVTRAVIPESTLDIEARRILLHIPALYDLDLDLDAPESKLSSVFGKNNTANEALKLKRMRNFDVDNARAEWRVADRAIVLLV